MADAILNRGLILGALSVFLFAAIPASGESWSSIPKVQTFNYVSGPPAYPANVVAPAKRERVDLFQAVAEGAIEAKVVARDENHLRIILKNPGKTPLSITLPPVLAARPALAQFDFFNQGGGQNGGLNLSGQGSQRGQSQAVAGPTTFGITANGAGNQGNNVFAVPAESVRQLRVRTVCVEHGKPNPRSVLKYELVRPVEAGVGPELSETLVAYGRGEVGRDSMQAAAWHLANGKSWDELQNMTKMVALNAREPLFTSQELAEARRAVESAQKRVAMRKQVEASIERVVDLPLLPSNAADDAAKRRLPHSAEKKL